MKREDVQDRAAAALDELVQALEAGKSESLVAYLEMLSRFHRYSFGNCMLIALQSPQATFVAGFRRWLEFGRHVKAGEKGIAILAPLVSRPKKKDTDAEQPPAAEAETSEEGTESPRPRVLRGFRVVHVFDVSQTDGAPLTEFATISGDPGEKLGRLEAVIRSHGIELGYHDIPGGALGVSEGGRIVVVPTLLPPEKFSVLAHELAHELLHRGDRRQETTKQIRETEAEAVAFVVCRGSGIESRDRSSDYIQLYRGDKALLLESLEHVQRVATSILSALEDGSLLDGEDVPRHDAALAAI